VKFLNSRDSVTIKEAIKKSGLKNGMTISFHHHLREGDEVVLKTLSEIKELGIKNLTLSCTSLLNAHDKIVDYIEDGTITSIHTTGLKAKLAKYVVHKGLKTPVIFRSHGGRARALQEKNINVDVAFISAAAVDSLGNATGSLGKNSFGSLGYGIWEAQNANKVIIVTDNVIKNDVLPYISIPQYRVNEVVSVDSIGNSSKIKAGSLIPKFSYNNFIIAKKTAEIIINLAGSLNNKSLQLGSGSISIQVMKFISEHLKRKNEKLKFMLGGITEFILEAFNENLVQTIFDIQSFSPECSYFIGKNPSYIEIDSSWYANPKVNCLVNYVDFSVLSAVEIDLNWNVNSLISSDYEIIGAIGGHQDVAEGSNITIITAPLIRGRIPIIVDKVKAVTTPGKNVDILVTDFGIAVNPLRKDIINDLLSLDIEIFSLKDLYKKAEDLVGIPEKPKLSDKVVGIIENRTGEIIDYIYCKEGD